jgi:hypothetical protein
MIHRSQARRKTRHHGLRRARVWRHWRDETAYLMSVPANRAWIEGAIAQLDRWRELRGAPPFGTLIP